MVGWKVGWGWLCFLLFSFALRGVGGGGGAEVGGKVRFKFFGDVSSQLVCSAVCLAGRGYWGPKPYRP